MMTGFPEPLTLQVLGLTQNPALSPRRDLWRSGTFWLLRELWLPQTSWQMAPAGVLTAGGTSRIIGTNFEGTVTSEPTSL